MKRPLLEVRELSVVFGGVRALDGASFVVEPGSICGLIGPNGAGKTTAFNAITRFYEPADGQITFEGTDLLQLRPHEIMPLGIARTFQNVALIPAFTVFENVCLGGHVRAPDRFLATMLRTPGTRAAETERHELADSILHELELTSVARRHPSDLPMGTLKRVEIARALMSDPTLLLLDEPARGLTMSEVGELGDRIQRVQDERDLALLLVEHHMGMVMNMSDHVVVLDYGEVIASGTPREVRENPAVIEAYLGPAK